MTATSPGIVEVDSAAAKVPIEFDLRNLLPADVRKLRRKQRPCRPSLSQRCVRCRRLAVWWGIIYYEGDYEGPGWCLVCFRKRCWFKKAGSRMSELAIKKWVQPHDPIAGIIYCYVAGDLTKDIKDAQRWAKISAWQHFW